MPEGEFSSVYHMPGNCGLHLFNAHSEKTRFANFALAVSHFGCRECELAFHRKTKAILIARQTALNALFVGSMSKPRILYSLHAIGHTGAD